MEKVPGKGVASESEVVEEKGDLKPMFGCAPGNWGMDGSTVDDTNKDPMLDCWEAPRLNDEVILTNPNGVPSMVETMALINDTVGVDETSEPRICDGVTISKVCAGLAFSVEKHAEEVAVEVRPSMDKGRATILKVGLLGSKNGKGRYDGSNESRLSLAERGFILRCFLGESTSLASGSMVKSSGLKRRKGVRLCNDSPKPTSGPSRRSHRDLHRGRKSATVNI